MFLMNAPPVAPLRSRWGPSGPPGSFRVPGLFSESRGAAARASVRASVQMIISSLQREEAAGGASHGRARAQRGRPAAGHRGRPVFATCGRAADGDPGLAPPAPDSDSDDSVDRGIEEAIQEYLRAKSGGPRPGPPEPPPRPTPPVLGPPTPAPGPAGAPGGSPGSASSEDSFEQSIRAEIEQFLHEKRRHETRKGAGPPEARADPGGRPTAAGLDGPGPRQGPAAARKEFVFRRPPRLAKANAQPEAAEPPSPRRARPAAPQPPRGRPRRGAGAPRGRRLRSAALPPEASDSSSDDGIEEAIRLYQREKTRKGAGGEPPPRAQLGGEKGATPPPPPQSPGPEARRRAPSKKKPAAPRAPDPPAKLPRDAQAPAAPAPPAGEPAEQASRRAEASAELMCAEAILDISKAVLPPRGPPLRAPAPPSRPGGDSSAVDSDDSIEQEIRTFLALKARAGRPQPAPRPPPPPAPGAQADPPDTLLPKPPERPLGCKRKRRGGGGSAPRPATPKKARDPREGAQDGSHGPTAARPPCDGQDPARQAKAGQAPARQGEAQSQPAPSGTAGPRDPRGAPGSGGLGQADEGGRVGGKQSPEDKSSSLDSDEDLDTAIKDLLRSKQKPRRKDRDPQAAGKKKVRFSTTETRFVEKLCGLPGGWAGRGPRVLRSCLSRPRGCGGAGLGPRTPRSLSGPAERTEAGGSGGRAAAPAFGARRRTPRGAAPSWDTGAGRPPPSAPGPGPLSEDSSVDSDDSIELEIRKFLAEKARECVGGSGGPVGGRAGGPAGPEAPCRKEPAPQPGIRTRSQRARGGPPPSEGGWGAERAGAEGARGGSSGGGNASAKTAPAGGRRNACAPRDQSPRGATPAAAESPCARPSGCVGTPAEAAGAAGAFRLDYGSGVPLGPGPGPQADPPLPWSDCAHQSRLSGPWVPSAEGRGSPWPGGPGGWRGKGTEGPAGGPGSRPPGPRRSLPFSSFPPRLSPQLFHFGKSTPWGGRPAGLFGPPTFPAFREGPASHGPVFGSPHLLARDGGPRPGGRARGEPGPRRRGPGSEDGGILDLRFRRRAGDGDPADPEAPGSDGSDGSDTSAEDAGGPAAVKGKALQL
ncbi:LOW QUALITY PROTEIN: protein phosphatase 1 regulatory subunit 26 [Perognathus longimembris pacificus]|uniref:LOW QUALITY PROTEIN: protein phosphatase 1 regulatory subunit 26 n=1 Tax=Perognathus longimembris pacificus TaxID=214514 RepID=UPI002018F63C|nr:LOW QUALITY PROTEIN: protein phosphatase 1 regulatory subunit 26 [Perognathus longimembris pacificus]